MRKSLCFIVILASASFYAGSASAKTVDIKGTWTSEQVKASCEKAGATNFTDGGGPNGNLYGCDKPCTGGICSVTCASGKCQGTIPRTAQPCIFFCRPTVMHVLRNRARR
jgi:hypothetical protein